MKKLQIIIRPEKLTELEAIISELKISGMMVSNIMGFGNQMGYTKQYRGTKYTVNLVSKLKCEIIVKDDVVEPFMKTCHERLATGNVGDGKIFVYPVENAMRIRTGETGDDAL